MASIREINGNYYVRFRDENRTPKEKAIPLDPDLYPTHRERHMRMQELDLAYKRGEYDPWRGGRPKVNTKTIAGAVDAYCDHKERLGMRDQQGGWNRRTARNYRANLMAFARSVGANRTIDSLSTRDIADWIFREDLADATQRMYRRQLRTFAAWLKRENVADVELPRPFRPRKKLKDFPTPGDLQKICKAHRSICIEKTKKKHAPKHGPRSARARLWMADAFATAFYQGYRLGELIAQRVGGVDLERGLLRIGDEAFVPKGRDERVIPIVAPARQYLQPRVEGRGAKERVFSYKSAGRVSAAFREARKRAFPGRDGLHFHSLRHGCAVYWLRKGRTPYYVQGLLRHKSIKTTEQYLQFVPQDLRRQFG